MKRMFENLWGKENSPWFNEEREKWGILQNMNTGTTQIRPKWELVYEDYPKNAAGTDDKDADIVFKEILGDNYDKNTFSNACATRVSLGLLNGGVSVKKRLSCSKGEI